MPKRTRDTFEAQLNIRVTPQEKDFIAKWGERYGWKEGTVLRFIMRDAIKRYCEIAGDEVPAPVAEDLFISPYPATPATPRKHASRS
jgi:hypothetical protein